MSHGFLVYIDESGDEGFVFADGSGHKSSEWFVLSALILKTSTARNAIRYWKELTNPIEVTRGPLHFVNLSHELKVALIYKLSQTENCWTISVCVNKPALPMPHTLSTRGQRRLYFYATRLLLERISWFVSSHTEFFEPNRPAKLIFSRCKRLSYLRLGVYLSHLKTQGKRTSIEWTNLDCDRLRVKGHEESLGLRMADAVASGLRRGLELSPYGFCEPRYAVLLKRITYSRLKKYLSYGLKFLPTIPAIEPTRDNRYKWIQKY